MMFLVSYSHRDLLKFLHRTIKIVIVDIHTRAESSPAPLTFLRGFYWYGGQRRKPGRPHKWIAQVLYEQLETENLRKSNQSCQD